MEKYIKKEGEELIESKPKLKDSSLVKETNDDKKALVKEVIKENDGDVIKG